MKKIDDYFREKEVCWAKIKGYPWWPGMINRIINRNQKLVYEIIYLGEKEKMLLNKGLIRKWKENYNQYKSRFDADHKISKKIRTSFDCALKLAELLIEQKINIDENFSLVKHFQILKRKRNKESIIKYINEINDNNNNNAIPNIIKSKIINDDDTNDINTKDEINNNDDYSNYNTNLDPEINFNRVRISIESWYNDEEKEIKKNEVKENQYSYLRKKFKRSRSVKKLLEKKKKNQELEKEKENQDDISKDNEIGMSHSDLNKMKNLLNIITNNIDAIMEKSDKYQKHLKNEFSKIKFDSKDSRQINFKIGLITYVKIMCEILNVPISLNKYIQSMNSQKY